MFADILYRLIRTILFILGKWLFSIKIEGKQNIPKEGGVILAANHTSYLDIPCIAFSSSRRIYFIAREGLFKNWLMKIIMNFFGTISLARWQADLSAMRKAIQSIKEGKVVCLFPEGTRSEDGKLSNILGPGVGFLAVKSNAPVVPLYIHGTHKILPKGNRWIHCHPVKVILAKPLYPEGIASQFPMKERYHQFTQQVSESLQALQEKMSEV